MGQRLNLTIILNENTYVNAYYHWSGYTKSAISLALQVVEAYESDDLKKMEDDIVKAVKLLETTGATLTKNEKEYIDRYFKPQYVSRLEVPEEVDRNFGLISVSPSGVVDTLFFEETRIEINFMKKAIIYNEKENKLEAKKIYGKPRFNLDVFHKCNEEDVEDYGIENFVRNPFGEDIVDFSNLTVEELKRIYDVIKDTKRDWSNFYLELKNGYKKYYWVIE